MNEPEIERVARLLVRRIFAASGRCTFHMATIRNEQGGQVLRCAWMAGGWKGELELCKPAQRELTSKDLAVVLAIMNEVPEEP